MAAKELLGWTIEKMAQETGVSEKTIRNFANGLVTDRTRDWILAGLKKNGVEFIPGGVRKKITPLFPKIG